MMRALHEPFQTFVSRTFIPIVSGTLARFLEFACGYVLLGAVFTFYGRRFKYGGRDRSRGRPSYSAGVQAPALGEDSETQLKKLVKESNR